MIRPDLSDYLTHWIRADDMSDAYWRLESIIDQRRIYGGTGFIKGDFRCVCFTETSDNIFHLIHKRYQPFGVQFLKKHIFSLGGRPVIYGKDTEYYLLAEDQKWRHVRYEPDIEHPIDFTWEREWRIRIDELPLPHGDLRIVIPCGHWEDVLLERHNKKEEYRIIQDALMGGMEYLAQTPEAFPYEYKIISV